MGIRAFVCRLSEKRRALLSKDPSLVVDLVHTEEEVPGLVHLDKTWDALEKMLGPRTAEVITGKVGEPLGEDLGFGVPHAIDAEEVVRLADRLTALPRDFVVGQYSMLAAVEVHGDYGSSRSEVDRQLEIEALGAMLARVTRLYRDAADAGDGMLVGHY